MAKLPCIKELKRQIASRTTGPLKRCWSKARVATSKTIRAGRRYRWSHSTKCRANLRSWYEFWVNSPYLSLATSSKHHWKSWKETTTRWWIMWSWWWALSFNFICLCSRTCRPIGTYFWTSYLSSLTTATCERHLIIQGTSEAYQICNLRN